MRLTAFTDYCLRALLATIDEIAERYRVNRNHLVKVVFRLSQLGYLRTLRGKGGESVSPTNRPSSISGDWFGRPNRILRWSNASRSGTAGLRAQERLAGGARGVLCGA
jgi:hypothetical protein